MRIAGPPIDRVRIFTTMDQDKILDRIKQEFPEFVRETHSQLGQDTVIVDKSAVVEVARFLKEDQELNFNILADLTAVDYWKEKPRFEVVYHFLSLENKFRLRVKARVEETEAELPSLCSLWPAANWYEREVFDMFGIRFTGHPDLKRILMYPGFEGYPLRKDYPKTRHQPLVEYRELPLHGNENPTTKTNRKRDND